MRTLHNRLREYGLRRRNANRDDVEIYQPIQQELDGPGCMIPTELVVLASPVMTSSSLFETLGDHLLPQGHFLLQNHYCIVRCQGSWRHKADLHHWWKWDHHYMLQNV